MHILAIICWLLVTWITYKLDPSLAYAVDSAQSLSDGYTAVKSQNTVIPNPLCQLHVTFATSRDVPFSPNSITPTSPKLPWTDFSSVTEDTRETMFLFQRLSVAIQRGNAVSFQATFANSEMWSPLQSYNLLTNISYLWEFSTEDLKY